MSFIGASRTLGVIIAIRFVIDIGVIQKKRAAGAFDVRGVIRDVKVMHH